MSAELAPVFKEIEYKYDATNVTIASLDKIMNQIAKKRITVSSYDEYYVSSSDHIDFIRYRYNEGTQELTLKKKTCKSNNNNRHEININISDAHNTRTKISQFVGFLGYHFKFKIYKTSIIYYLNKAIVAYYIVYDEDMKERGRFVEIEADETHPWKSESEAFYVINECEKLLEGLGITYRNRMKKSLFEIFGSGSVETVEKEPPIRTSSRQEHKVGQYACNSLQ